MFKAEDRNSIAMLQLPQTVSLEGRTRLTNGLIRIAYVELALLLAKIVLGIILNPFVTIPSDGLLERLSIASFSVLVLHIVLDFALLAVGIGLVVLALGTRSAAAISGSIVVAFGVIISFASGSNFLLGQGNVYSSFIAVGFLFTLAGISMIRAPVPR